MANKRALGVRKEHVIEHVSFDEPHPIETGFNPIKAQLQGVFRVFEHAVNVLSRGLCSNGTEGVDADWRLALISLWKHPRFVEAFLALLDELEPGYGVKNNLQSALLPAVLLEDPQHSHPCERAWTVYLYRSAFFAAMRLLLLVVWVELGALPPNAPAQGRESSPELGEAVQRVLTGRYGFASAAYQWLWNPASSPYGLYTASQDSWDEALEALRRSDRRELLAVLSREDVLGSVYERSLPREAQKGGGQYYTPTAIASLVLDRMGLTPARLRASADILDPSFGSGAFLLACARRMLAANLETDLANIVSSLHGAEISLFSWYVCQVNLLIALAPSACGRGPTSCSAAHKAALSLLRADSLSLLSESSEYHLNDVLFTRLSRVDSFDFCVGNPPYLGEKGNKELFQSVLQRYPAWIPYHQGRMDYLYFFILLGISKLREGGRLGFVTTRYWLTADGASVLRREILARCRVLEIIDFGNSRVFDSATGQHNLIVVLEKCESEAARRNHYPKWILIKDASILEQNAGNFMGSDLPSLLPTTDMLNEWMDVSEDLENPWVRVSISPKPQGAWTDEAFSRNAANAAKSSVHSPPWLWPGLRGEDDLLEKIRAAGCPLGEVFHHQQGVISGADKVTAQNIRYLSPEAVERDGIRVGDGIFCLSPQELECLALSPKELAVAKPFFKNSHVMPYHVAMARQEASFLLYITKETPLEEYPALKAHLERFEPILARKRECQVGSLPWYSLHWPRDPRLLEAPSLVVSRRAAFNCFALSEPGWFENSDLTVLVPKASVWEDSLYFLALLNSSLLDFWMERRGKPKGNLREYYATPLLKIPLARVSRRSPAQMDTYRHIVDLARQTRDTQKALAEMALGFPALNRLIRFDLMRHISVEALQSLPPAQRKRFVALRGNGLALQRRLNALIYALYDLTPSEISLVESRGSD